MWRTIRTAIKTWGETLRFCLIVLLLSGVYLGALWFLQRWPLARP